MTELSPQAQAVLDAAHDVIPDTSAGEVRAIAAALRAAADQAVPEPSDLDKELFSISALRLRWAIRDQFLAIVTELEATND